MRLLLTIITLLVAQIAISQQQFPLSDSIIVTHQCSEGTFVDFAMMPGEIQFTFPNSHDLYHLERYDADPVWDNRGFFWSCFAGKGFHGFYVLDLESIHVRLVLEDYGVTLRYGSPNTFTPKCFKE